MSRTSRRQHLDIRLHSLESDFQATLIEELRACAAGKRVMFGHNEGNYVTLDGRTRKLVSSVEKDLLVRATEIERLRDELGHTEPFALGQRYREYRDMRGPNAPGEPKMAKLFLQELGLS